jgi:hypothetical protein
MMIDFDQMMLTLNDMMEKKMIHHSQLFVMNQKQSNSTLKNIDFKNYKRQLISKTMFDFKKNKIIYEVENFEQVDISNAVNFHVALINMIKKKIFYYIFQVQAIEKCKRSEHKNFMQYLSNAINSTDNFTSFKISSEEENKESIMKKRKFCKKVILYVSKVIKTFSFNMLLSSAADSLLIDDDLKMKEVI